jgi:periplasmic protein TonB
MKTRELARAMISFKKAGVLTVIGLLHIAVLWFASQKLALSPSALALAKTTQLLNIPVIKLPAPLPVVQTPPPTQRVLSAKTLPKSSIAAVTAAPQQIDTAQLVPALVNELPASAPPVRAIQASRQDTSPALTVASIPATVSKEIVAPLTLPKSDASHLHNRPPVYPAASRRLGEQGRVLMDVFIRADGSVGEIRLKSTSGYARLDQAALEAVQQWRYQPARRGTEAIDFWFVQPLSFTLES